MNKLELKDDGLDELRILRNETISRWKKMGLLKGLKPMSNEQKNNICELFECQETRIIGE